MKNIFNAFYSHKSVLKYFKPESQINTTTVLPLKDDLSSSTAAATLAPDEKPGLKYSSLGHFMKKLYYHESTK